MFLKFFLLITLFYVCQTQDNTYIRNVIKETKVTKIPFKVTKPIIKRSRNFSIRPVVKEIKEEEKILIVTKPIIKRFRYGSTTPMNNLINSTTEKTTTENLTTENLTTENLTSKKTTENLTTEKLTTENLTTEKKILIPQNSFENEEDIRYNNLDIDLLKKTLNNCKYKYYEYNTEENINTILSFFNDNSDYSNYHYSIKIIENYLPYFNKKKSDIEKINKNMNHIKNNYNNITDFTKDDINISMSKNKQNFGTYLCSKIFKTLKGYENVLNIKIFARNTEVNSTILCNIIFSTFVLPNINLDDSQVVVLQQVVIPLENLPAYQICDNGNFMIKC